MSRYVIPFEQLRMTDVDSVGGKNASLGEMISQLPASVRVPGGFATTAAAYREFLSHQGLADRISQKLAALDTDGKITRRWPVAWKLTGLLPGDAARDWKATLPLREASVTGLNLALRVIHPLANGKPLCFANAEQDRHAPGWLSLGVLP
mgnify:CR=1 FL=1